MPETPHRELRERLESLERQTAAIRRELRALWVEFRGLEEGEAGVEPRPETASPPPPTEAVSAPRPPDAEERPSSRGLDLEFWLGGRGLLLLGVVALVMAVGFFVKYSIEQGWLGPSVRVSLGAAVGIAAIIAGERIRASGYRTYGLWLAAGGFSAVYLSVWAAAILYGLFSATVAFALMVIVVGAAAAVGLLRGSQSFVALAAFGGYLAPVLLQVESASTGLSLAYLALITGSGLWLAHRSTWPGLAALVVAGGTLMTLPGGGSGSAYVVYLIVLVATALWVTRRHGWTGIAAEVVALGWLTFKAGSGAWQVRGTTFDLFAAALWLACLIGSLGVRRWGPAGRGGAGDESVAPRPRRVDLAELAGLVVMAVPPWAFYFSVIAGITDAPWGGQADVVRLALGGFLGAVYVSEVWLLGTGSGTAGRPWRMALGCSFWLVAPSLVWSAVPLSRAWLLEAALFTAAGLRLRTVEYRAAGLSALTLSVVTYYGVLAQRPDGDVAFWSLWSLTGLAVAIGPAAWALAVERLEGAAAFERGLRPMLFLASAVMFLGWGTAEIFRFYELRPGPEAWTLARDLSISGFWLAYAAALLAVGFWLDRPPVRWAGLGMAIVVAGKTFLYDLANLAHLYRIASFMLLAAVLLALSFRYQGMRRGRQE